jgi:hypothetical protein
MRFMLEIRIPSDRGNELLRDPQFGQKMQQVLVEIKAEAAYFGTVGGQRGGWIILNMDDASEMPVKAEPLFLWLHADVTAKPVMKPEDLQKAGPAIGGIVQRWG